MSLKFLRAVLFGTSETDDRHSDALVQGSSPSLDFISHFNTSRVIEDGLPSSGRDAELP